LCDEKIQQYQRRADSMMAWESGI